MTTRLDRLLLILDTGSSPATRKTAAKQVGEVQKYHPHELPNLLQRVHVFLKSKNWDTRIAAAQAIEAICQNVPQWNPDGEKSKIKEETEKEGKEAAPVKKESNGKLAFDDFDVNIVLEKGEKLLGSAGDEFDVEDEINTEGMSQEDILKERRQMLHKRLGLDSGIDLGMGDLIDDNDLLANSLPKRVSRQCSAENVSDAIASQFAAISSLNDLSTREKNKAKRKVKSLMKQRSKENESRSFDNGDIGPPEKRQRRTQSVLVEQPSEDKILMDNIADETLSLDELEEWPFEKFTNVLCSDLFHPSWEVRHGAASALREIIKIHGAGAGKKSTTPVLEMDDVNRMWLDDVALKLLCVFALDRFGDFVSDEVVAPVRETCAQTLGSVLHHMKESSVYHVLTVLVQLQENEHWQVKHGGLLGLKYMLAVRKDLGREMLPLVLPWILTGLKDGDDDVRAVAADALLPVSSLLVELLPKATPDVISILWDIMLELDDLTASTNSVMNLLSSLTSSDTVSCNNELQELVPRLFPFFNHSISSVRSSVLKTLKTLLEIPQDVNWLESIAEKQLSHMYQRIVLEPCAHTRSLAVQVWKLTVDKLTKDVLQTCVQKLSPMWFRLLVQPSNLPIDSSLLIGGSTGDFTQKKSNAGDSINGKIFLANTDSTMDDSIKQSTITNTRIQSASCIGLLLSIFANDDAYQQITNYLLAGIESFLSSRSATQHLSAAFVIEEWVKISKTIPHCYDNIILKLKSILSSQIVYDESLPLYQRLQIDTKSLVFYFKEKGVELSASNVNNFSIETATAIAHQMYIDNIGKLSKKDISTAESKQKCLVAAINNFQSSYLKHHTRVQASVASALVSINKLTEKLNPIIRPIMESIKREEDEQLQKRISIALSQLLVLCLQRAPCPNGKIIKNLCSFVCNDSNQTPQLHIQNVDNAAKSSFDTPCCKCDTTMGVLTLQRKQKEAFKSSISKRGRLSRNNSGHKDLDLNSSFHNLSDATESSLALQVQRKGSEVALSTCASYMQDQLINKLPSLWETLYTNIHENVIDTEKLSTDGSMDDRLKQLVCSMQILEVTAQSLHNSLKSKLTNLLDNLSKCLNYPYTSIRHMAARCFGTLSKVIKNETMNLVLTKVSDIIYQRDNVIGRQGAVEALVCVIENLGLDILPYIVLFIVPILSCMSDQIEVIRLTATNCFATLVQLMPLEAGIPNPPSMSPMLVEKKTKERHFLEQLLDNTKIDKFTISVPIRCELRKYQQDGVSWLAFLLKYNLHGILCDDMGLGKTLQSICIMAADYHNSMKKYKISGKEEFKPHPSLVVCPPTLTGHWCFEVDKFCDKEHLNPLHYTGSPGERQRLQALFNKHNLVVASYDIIRNDSDFFLSKYWNFCILDEGHIIKNSKTKLSRVIKQIRANHRLILSGTPIQNNVLELWSLFDFLMPGFLGSEKEFTAKFGKPILQSRDAKSSKDQEAGALAMEALHKQTLPFLLRRVKEDVLQDLPPKIIQDYYCDLSPLQVKLYEDFSRSQARKNIDVTVEDSKQETKETGHIFQALQYLRKVCNHPSLVLKPTHPEYSNIMESIKSNKVSLNSIQHSGKLLALKQLLLDCGIGVTEGTSSSESNLDAIVSQHRALIFCQLKSMLDLVENTLLKGEMSCVTYARLDGSVPASQRHDIVQRFNNDPSIDVLLLTTHVGGLGLNLTGADTVIFVEHDWNPMKDLQAMDRAHRIGQKKVVNVYRLIARATLEEKIMGLQKFKMNIANTVITQDNSSLQAMDTSQLLDLFTVGNDKGEKKPSAAVTANKPQSMKGLLENMDELWAEDQYSNEYDLSQFMSSLKQ